MRLRNVKFGTGKLRNIIRNWLGFAAVESDLWQIKSRYERMEQTWQQATAELQDFDARGNTRIVVASNLGRGFSKWYDFRFKNHQELVDFCEMLAHREVSSQRPYIDGPYDYEPMINDMRSRKGLPITRGKR
jgi:hypothetical protein